MWGRPRPEFLMQTAKDPCTPAETVYHVPSQKGNSHLGESAEHAVRRTPSGRESLPVSGVKLKNEMGEMTCNPNRIPSLAVIHAPEVSFRRRHWMVSPSIGHDDDAIAHV